MKFLIKFFLLFLPIIVFCQPVELQDPFISNILSKYNITGNSEYYINDFLIYKDKIFIVGGYGKYDGLNSNWEKIVLEIIDLKSKKSNQIILHDTFLWSNGSPIIVPDKDNIKIFWGRSCDDFTYIFNYNLLDKSVSKNKIYIKYTKFNFLNQKEIIHIYNGNYFQIKNNTILLEEKLVEFYKSHEISEKMNSIDWTEKVGFTGQILFINNNLIVCSYIKAKRSVQLREMMVEVYNLDKRELTHFSFFKIKDMVSKKISGFSFPQMVPIENNNQVNSIFIGYFENGKNFIGKIDFDENGIPIKPSANKNHSLLPIQNTYISDAKWFAQINVLYLKTDIGEIYGKKIDSIKLFGYKAKQEETSKFYRQYIKVIK